MIDQNPQKKKLNIDLQKMKGFLDLAKKYLKGIYDFFRDNKNNSKVLLFIALVTTGIAIYFALQLYSDIHALNGKTSQLVNLDSYDTRALQADAATQQSLKTSDTIQDLIENNTLTQAEINKYDGYLHSLQVPYTYFLQYIYLPSLNIRKEKYTDKIDTNLIGINFLEKNPFNDITLIQKRGDFFKDVGDNNESNEVQDMTIGDITEDGSGYFSMPITVSFTANSKRAFLLLADKLSMTSNKENVSLINEFFYYLRNEIKKDKDKEIKNLEGQYADIFGSGENVDDDKLIGYHLYDRIFNDGKNTLIDDTIIDKTIKSVISCNNESDELCYYQFRERYRDIPTFGYMLGTNVGSNGAENLKQFIKSLPPIFSVKEFSFDKVPSPTLADATNNTYQGKVTIVVYGRSASQEEVGEIAQALGKKCLGENRALTSQEGLSLIQSAIVKLSEISTIDKSYGDNLRELKGIIQQLDEEYPSLSNYKKTIKLFELYRMLSDAGLCK